MRSTLKKARENAGFTQEEFAKEIEVSIYTVQKYEQGRRTPKIPRMKKIMELLNNFSINLFDLDNEE